MPKNTLIMALIISFLTVEAYFIFSNNGGAQEMTNTFVSQESAIPPIDLRIPAKTETVTFALG